MHSPDHSSGRWPGADLVFFPYSEGGVLFRPHSRRIWTLNPIAAVIWCLALERSSVDAICSELVAVYGISPEQARRDTESVLQALGVANCHDGGIDTEKRGTHVEDGNTVGDGAVSANSSRMIPSSRGRQRYYFATPGCSLELASTDDAIAEEYGNAMMAFRVLPGRSSSDVRLEVLSTLVAGRKRFEIYLNGRCRATRLQGREVLPCLLGASFNVIAESLAGKLLFHAAIVEKNDHAFIFPGASGSGKTTLAASLVRAGYCFFADELALLDPVSGMVSPLPLPMSIKAGAFATLSGSYPELDRLPVYARADGKQVKILPPPLGEGFDLHKQILPAILIFPRYQFDAPGRMNPLSKADALGRLVSLCSSPRPLGNQDLAAMIRLVDDHCCFEAVYSDTATVADFLEQASFRMSSGGLGIWH